MNWRWCDRSISDKRVCRTFCGSNTGCVGLTALAEIVWTAGRVIGLSVIEGGTEMAGSSDTE